METYRSGCEQPQNRAAPQVSALVALARRTGEVALELVSPTRCCGCERPGALVCDACLHRLNLIDPVHACVCCGAPYGDVVCTECAGENGFETGCDLEDACAGASAPLEALPSPLARCLAMAVFEGPLPRIIRAYKDAGERRLASLFAEMLCDTALHAESVAPDRYGGIVAHVDCLVFVPATAAAYRRRGFDHMEEIAAALADLLEIPLLDALAKHGSADQRRLSRAERKRCSHGQYEVVEEVTGTNILLVDDVITTGATMNAAARSLVRAGAARVEGLALARVLGS